MFYAVIYDETSGAPLNCRWVRQFRIPLDWLLSFFDRNKFIERHYSLQSYLRLGDNIAITTDASPFGVGGVLEVDSHIVAFFSDQVNRHPLPDSCWTQLRFNDYPFKWSGCLIRFMTQIATC